MTSENSKAGNAMQYVAVSEAEHTVLEKLWDQEEPIKQSKLLALFEEDGKEWKRQTLNTFLSRLEAKGLVERKSRLVKATCSREEYNCLQMKTAIDDLYGGRLSNFVAAFVRENPISDNEADALIKILENS